MSVQLVRSGTQHLVPQKGWEKGENYSTSETIRCRPCDTEYMPNSTTKALSCHVSVTICKKYVLVQTDCTLVC